MKRLFFVFLSLLVQAAWAQVGVKWEPEVHAALVKAKTSGRLLFVEAYLPTCPSCQAVEPNFKNESVAKVYNDHFVNYKMNLSKEGERKFLDDRRIEMPSFPQFLFFDENGILVHQSEVLPTPESLINVANDAINPETRTSNFYKRFEKGDRDFNFLVKYGVYTKIMNDTAANRKVNEALFQQFSAADLGSEISWGVTKKISNSTEDGFFKYWIKNVSKAAEYEKKAGHAGQEMNTLGRIVQVTLLSGVTKYYSTQQLAEIRSYMGAVGAAEYADVYLWESEVRAHIRENKWNEALAIGQNIAQKFGGNGPSLIFITKVFNDAYPNLEYYSQAKDWLGKARNLIKENNYLAELNFEWARLEQRNNNVVEAKKYAEESLKYGKLATIDTQRFENLLQTLK